MTYGGHASGAQPMSVAVAIRPSLDKGQWVFDDGAKAFSLKPKYVSKDSDAWGRFVMQFERAERVGKDLQDFYAEHGVQDIVYSVMDGRCGSVWTYGGPGTGKSYVLWGGRSTVGFMALEEFVNGCAEDESLSLHICAFRVMRDGHLIDLYQASRETSGAPTEHIYEPGGSQLDPKEWREAINHVNVYPISNLEEGLLVVKSCVLWSKKVEKKRRLTNKQNGFDENAPDARFLADVVRVSVECSSNSGKRVSHLYFVEVIAPVSSPSPPPAGGGGMRRSSSANAKILHVKRDFAPETGGKGAGKRGSMRRVSSDVGTLGRGGKSPASAAVMSGCVEGDTVLTQVLSELLTNESRNLLIATIALEKGNEEATMLSLRLAQRAEDIFQRPDKRGRGMDEDAFLVRYKAQIDAMRGCRDVLAGVASNVDQARVYRLLLRWARAYREAHSFGLEASESVQYENRISLLVQKARSPSDERDAPVTVVVRVRPMNGKELLESDSSPWTLSRDSLELDDTAYNSTGGSSGGNDSFISVASAGSDDGGSASRRIRRSMSSNEILGRGDSPSGGSNLSRSSGMSRGKGGGKRNSLTLKRKGSSSDVFASGSDGSGKRNSIGPAGARPKNYRVERVYGPSNDTEEIYNEKIKQSIIMSATGINTTIFAYGQTSSGKTFTMLGSPANPGVIPRALIDVFNTIEAHPERLFLVRVSYIEIYNEVLSDLIGDGKIEGKLEIVATETGTSVSGVREEVVFTAEQVLYMIEQGQEKRHVGSTDMNEHSSRSHTIFRMIIESTPRPTDGGMSFLRCVSGGARSLSALDNKTGPVRVSVLNLVDLAGSERASQTNATGARLKEGAHINASLMALGKVIKCISEGNDAHAPFRESKLTRLLQTSLGGNARTIVICNASPAAENVSETESTLRFAMRAKRIVNKTKINEKEGDKQQVAVYQQQMQEITRRVKELKGEVQAAEAFAAFTWLLRRVRDRRSGQTSSVLVLQHRARAFLARKNFSNMRASAIELQRRWRGYRDRRAYEERIREHRRNERERRKTELEEKKRKLEREREIRRKQEEQRKRVEEERRRKDAEDKDTERERDRAAREAAEAERKAREAAEREAEVTRRAEERAERERKAAEELRAAQARKEAEAAARVEEQRAAEVERKRALAAKRKEAARRRVEEEAARRKNAPAPVSKGAPKTGSAASPMKRQALERLREKIRASPTNATSSSPSPAPRGPSPSGSSGPDDTESAASGSTAESGSTTATNETFSGTGEQGLWGELYTTEQFKRRFAMDKMLGTGTFARVVRATDRRNGRVLALKIMDKDAIDEMRIENYVRDEIFVMKSIPKHPHVVELIDVFETREKIILAMELATGGMLHEKMSKLPKKRFDEEGARNCFQQLIRGVDHCHKHSICHRDLKPENMLLHEDIVKITDFGFSKFRDGFSKQSTLCGTPAFLAPEILRNMGSGGGYDGFLVDVWACGIILYSILAGHVPYPGKDIYEMMRSHREMEISYPKKQFSPDAKDLISGMLEKDPAKRLTISQVMEHPFYRKNLEKTVAEVDAKYKLAQAADAEYGGGGHASSNLAATSGASAKRQSTDSSFQGSEVNVRRSTSPNGHANGNSSPAKSNLKPSSPAKPQAPKSPARSPRTARSAPQAESESDSSSTDSGSSSEEEEQPIIATRRRTSRRMSNSKRTSVGATNGTTQARRTSKTIDPESIRRALARRRQKGGGSTPRSSPSGGKGRVGALKFSEGRGLRTPSPMPSNERPAPTAMSPTANEVQSRLKSTADQLQRLR